MKNHFPHERQASTVAIVALNPDLFALVKLFKVLTKFSTQLKLSHFFASLSTIITVAKTFYFPRERRALTVPISALK